jgi:hypothetical protein
MAGWSILNCKEEGIRWTGHGKWQMNKERESQCRTSFKFRQLCSHPLMEKAVSALQWESTMSNAKKRSNICS